jgi:hypothetical protein
MTWHVACTSDKKVHTFFWGGVRNLKKVMYENLSINEGNIKTEHDGSVAGIHLSQGTSGILSIMVMNLYVPSNAGNFLSK